MFKKGEIILGLTLFVLFVAFLQTNYCYHFYYMEQIQLFLFNAQWAEDVLLQPGGVSLWLSRFMVQFFVVPWAGSIIISILLYGVWWSTKKGISGSSKSMQTSLLSLFSVVSLYPVIIDPNYFLQELEMLAVNNPKNQTAIQYLAAFYLVNKDLSRFKLLLEKYYATDVWPQLAVTQQQALPFIAPDDRKYWIQHGMSRETEHQYTLFERELVAQDGSSAIQKRLGEKYGDTYWYYLLFK